MAAESRQALLDAGRELLESRGVAPGLDRVTCKEAIELSGRKATNRCEVFDARCLRDSG